MQTVTFFVHKTHKLLEKHTNSCLIKLKDSNCSGEENSK